MTGEVWEPGVSQGGAAAELGQPRAPLCRRPGSPWLLGRVGVGAGSGPLCAGLWRGAWLRVAPPPRLPPEEGRFAASSILCPWDVVQGWDVRPGRHSCDAARCRGPRPPLGHIPPWQRAGPAASEHALRRRAGGCPPSLFASLNFLQLPLPAVRGGPCAILPPASLVGPVHPGGSGHVPCPWQCPNRGRRAGAVQRSVAKQPLERFCRGERSRWQRCHRCV